MKRFALLLPTLLLLLAPHVASAHEHASFVIKGTTYNIVIGSLNEPIAVDDKTGLDLAVTKGAGHHTMGPDGDMDGPIVGTVPVTGLEDTLKVELVAGKEKKTIPLRPAYGTEGVYQAFFIPTIATTFSYHLTGEIEGNAVDLTFTCLPDGKDAKDDDTQKELVGGVTQISRGGYFGCPAPKESLGFPEESASLVTLAQKIESGSTTTNVALALGAVGLALSVIALRRKK